MRTLKPESIAAGEELGSLMLGSPIEHRPRAYFSASETQTLYRQLVHHGLQTAHDEKRRDILK